MINFIPFSKPLMEDIFLADIPIQIFQAIKRKTAMECYDYWIVKTDSFGNIQWQNTIGGSNYDGLYSIQQTTDGGYILGGHSTSNISGDKTENSLWILMIIGL